nr:immunoglobulin light chain junction region [Macaca mulatta]MOW30940.1 immunoglobulin light chain junction region [Macaca mulatta]MOW30949.1 immunoglobulin light chain junction region [Macaca mulatta]MOW30951.1 immunoglobulin light chain junction region [Macaca mulatta]MOW30953.1 immunoglobulin light chain junction region [Macaca mulatta]
DYYCQSADGNYDPLF